MTQNSYFAFLWSTQYLQRQQVEQYLRLEANTLGRALRRRVGGTRNA